MKRQLKKLFAILAVVFVSMFASATFAGCSTDNRPVRPDIGYDLFLFNPYRNVNFATFGRYNADFHTHTTNSDGMASPDETARRYASIGFDFLAFADHDSWMFGRWASHPTGHITIESFEAPGTFNSAAAAQTWPWQDFGVREDNHGLIPIQTTEVTRTQHFGVFYTSFSEQLDFAGAPLSGPSGAGGKRHVMTRAVAHSMQYYPCDRTGNEPTIEEGQVRFEIYHPERNLDGGANNWASHLAHLNRPQLNGEYQFISAGYYQELLRDFPTILSFEIYNQADRHPSRHIYDRIIQGMFPHRPVWLSANSDEHGIHFGFSKNVMLLPERNEQAFRRAREQGAYFAVSFGDFNPNLLELSPENAHLADTRGANRWTHDPHTSPRLETQRWGDRWNYVPKIHDIVVNDATGYITIEASNYTRIEWITEGTPTDPQNIILEGNRINFRTNTDIKNFIRAQISFYNAEGVRVSTKYTQPFGVGQFDPYSWLFHFTGVDAAPIEWRD